MCYRHHVETNYTDIFSVYKMQKIKSDHESQFEKQPYKINEKVLKNIMNEMGTFWFKIDELNKTQHSIPEFSVDINIKSSFLDIITKLDSSIKFSASPSFKVANILLSNQYFTLCNF